MDDFDELRDAIDEMVRRFEILLSRVTNAFKSISIFNRNVAKYGYDDPESGVYPFTRVRHHNRCSTRVFMSRPCLPLKNMPYQKRSYGG